MRVATVLAAWLFAASSVSTADAQITRMMSQNALDHRIVVNGRGIVHVPADVLKLQVRLIVKPGVNDDDAGNAIADVMRANGVPDAQWTLPLVGLITGSSQGAILGTIRKPTRTNVENIARRVAHAIPLSLAANVANVNIASALGVDDCSAGRTQLQAKVMADARAKAKAIAAASGLKLGKIVGVEESISGTPGCGGDTFAPINLSTVVDGMYGPLEVKIENDATIVFETH